MLRFFFLGCLFAFVAVVSIAGWRGQKSAKPPIEIFPDMDHQPKFQPQRENNLFADGRSARKPVAGTVPMGYTLAGAFDTNGASNNRTIQGGSGFGGATDYYSTGRMGDHYGDGLPVEISEAVLKRGQLRYSVNCAVCHGATGLGNGITSQYGLVGIANLHQERLRTMPDGQIFQTITYGKGNMGPYGPNVAVEDRWAIIAYIRTLQRSQNARLADVPDEHRKDLEKP
jgi:mono/diheme cytochrome c family protein